MAVQNKTDINAYVHSKHELLTNIDEQLVPITATIRHPFECDDNQWLCAASIAGLFHRKAREMVESQPEEYDQSTELYVVSRDLDWNGDRNAALEKLVRAVELAPEAHEWRFDLALMFERSRMYTQAEREMRRCVQLQPRKQMYRSALQRLIYRVEEQGVKQKKARLRN